MRVKSARKSDVNSAGKPTSTQENAGLFGRMETEEDSLAFIQQTLFVSVATIMKERLIESADSFGRRDLEGVPFWTVSEKTNFGKRFVLMMRAVSDTIRKKYLRCFMLLVQDRKEGDSDVALEVHTICFAYEGENMILEFFEADGSMSRVKFRDYRTTVSQLKSLLSRIRNMSAHLMALPLNTKWTVKLLYHSGTPYAYEPRFFVSSSSLYRIADSENWHRGNYGRIVAKHHGCALYVDSCLAEESYNSLISSDGADSKGSRGTYSRKDSVTDESAVEIERSFHAATAVTASEANVDSEMLVHDKEVTKSKEAASEDSSISCATRKQILTPIGNTIASVPPETGLERISEKYSTDRTAVRGFSPQNLLGDLMSDARTKTEEKKSGGMSEEVFRSEKDRPVPQTVTKKKFASMKVSEERWTSSQVNEGAERKVVYSVMKEAGAPLLQGSRVQHPTEEILVRTGNVGRDRKRRYALNVEKKEATKRRLEEHEKREKAFMEINKNSGNITIAETSGRLATHGSNTVGSSSALLSNSSHREKTFDDSRNSTAEGATELQQSEYLRVEKIEEPFLFEAHSPERIVVCREHLRFPDDLETSYNTLSLVNLNDEGSESDGSG